MIQTKESALVPLPHQRRHLRPRPAGVRPGAAAPLLPAPAATPTSASVSAIAELTPDGTSFVITFTVDEGAQYNFGEVDVDSRAARPRARGCCSQLVQTESGARSTTPTRSSGDQRADLRGRRLGYAFVDDRAGAETHDREALTVDVTFQIDEGPRVYVERIDIVGNIRTLDQVIRREFRLAEGDAFNTALLRRSQQRIAQPRLLRDASRSSTVPGSAPTDASSRSRSRSSSTGELSFGAGFSTSDGLLGDVRLTRAQLPRPRPGPARQLHDLAARARQLDFSFTEPYFLDRDLAAGFDLFRPRTDFQSESSFDQTSHGGTLARRPTRSPRTCATALRYTLRAGRRSSNVDDDASRVHPATRRASDLTSLVGQTFTYDVRDTRFLPSRRLSAAARAGPRRARRRHQFIRHEGRADWYYRFRRTGC